MKTLTIRIESMDAFKRSFIDSAKSGKRDNGQVWSFPDYASLNRTLTPNRMAILQELMKGAALGPRELARALGKDHGNLQRDLQKLLEAEVVQKGDNGKLWVDFDCVHFEFDVTAAA